MYVQNKWANCSPQLPFFHIAMASWKYIGEAFRCLLHGMQFSVFLRLPLKSVDPSLANYLPLVSTEGEAMHSRTEVRMSTQNLQG